MNKKRTTFLLGTLLTALAGATLAQTLPPPPVSPTPVVNYEYDAQGNLTKTVQAPGVSGFGFATSATYDALSRLSTRTDAKNGLTQLGYNAQDRVTSVTDPRSLTTQTPTNGLGDVTSLSSPDTGTATHTYDAAGNLLTRTDSRGVLATTTYDLLNRPTALVFSKSGQANVNYGWTYDQTGSGFSNGIGRLTTATFPSGSRRYAYDAQGRIISATQTLGTVSLVGGYGYDSAGHVVQITYPSGRVLTISYANGVPTGMQLAKNASGTPSTLLSQISLQPFGGVQSWQWQMASGPVTHRREFDTTGRMTRYPLGNVVRDLSYDAADRIQSFTHLDAISAAAVPSLDQSFGYDELGRLTGITTASASWSLGYDANGNRTSVSLNGTPRNYAVSTTSNQLNALDNPARSFGLDAAGNTTSDTASYTSTYGLDNRLATLTIGGTTASYSYDDNGQRVSKTVNGVTTLFVYDLDGQLLGEYDQQGNAIQEHVWLGGMPVAVFKTDTANPTGDPLVFFIHTDHLNTPRVIVDRSGNVRWRWLAEPYGTTAAETNPSGLGVFAFNLRFPGQYADAESGLFFNWNRDYDPSTGRYVQSDPIGLNGGINTYAYVGGRPLSYIDPRGLQSTGLPNLEGEFRQYQDALVDAYKNVAEWAAADGLIGFGVNAIRTYRAAKAAEALRDAAGAAHGRRSATYAGGYKDGKAVAGRSSNPEGCAEDDISRQLGSDANMTKAYGWRRNLTTGELEWTEIPVCLRCQSKYPRSQFPRDVKAQPGGAWEEATHDFLR